MEGTGRSWNGEWIGKLSERTERPNQAAPLLTSCGLGSATLAWSDLFFVASWGQPRELDCVSRELLLAAASLGRVERGWMCSEWSEGFHPWSYYCCLSEGQARQRANQREGRTKEIWLLYFLENFWPFWISLPLTPNCRVWGVTHHTYLDLSLFLSVFFWTHFLCNHNMYLCSTIKTKTETSVPFLGMTLIATRSREKNESWSEGRHSVRGEK